MKDHEIRELINTLTAIAKAHGETQQLRQRIHEVIVPKIKAMNALQEFLIKTTEEAKIVYEEICTQLGAEKGGITHAIFAMKDEKNKVRVLWADYSIQHHRQGNISYMSSISESEISRNGTNRWIGADSTKEGHCE